MSDPEVRIRITGDASGATGAFADVNHALGQTEEAGKSFGESLKELGEKIFFPIEAFKQLKEIAHSAFETLLGDSVRIANQIDKMSKQFDVSTDSLQRLGYAAKQEHGSLEGVGQALKFLEKNLGEATNGNKELIDAFARIGISAEQLKSAKPEEIFEKLADVMSNDSIPQSEKMALAMKLMGRGANELMPMLKLGGDEIRRLGNEAERLGVVMSGSAIAASKQFEDSLTILSEAMQGIKNTLVEALAPALSEFAHWVGETIPPFVEALRDNMMSLYDALASTASVIGDILAPLWDAFAAGVSSAADAVGAFLGVTDGALSGLDSLADVLLGGIEVFLKFASDVKAALSGALAAIEHWGREAGMIFMSFFEGLGKSVDAVGDLFVALGEGFIDGFKALFDIVVASGKGIWEGFKAALSGGSFSDAFMGEFDKALDGINQRAIERTKELAASWDKIDVFGGMTDALEDEKKRYEQELADIGDANEEERKQIEGLISDIDKKIDARKRERQATRDAADAEAKAKEEARALAAAHRDLTAALEGTAQGAEGAAGAITHMYKGTPGSVDTVLDYTQRSGSPGAGGGAGGGFGGPTWGAMTRLGSSLTRGSQVWGINFDDVRTFKSKLDAERFAARENLRRQQDEEMRNLNDQTFMTGRERRDALAAMRQRHKEEMEALKKKQQEEAEGKQKERDKDKQHEKDKQKQQQGGGSPPKPPPPSPPPPKDATDGMKKLEDSTKKAEDAKKSLAENIKSEFSPTKPGNATSAIKDATSAIREMGTQMDLAGKGGAGGTKASGGSGLSDAIRQMQDDIRAGYMQSDLTPGHVASGGGGGGGGAGAPGGAGAGDGGGQAGTGGKGGAGGGGGKGSVSSGGGGGGAGGAGGGGGQGGKGGDATVSIHLPGFGPGISDAAARGLALYTQRYLRETVGLTNEYNEIARSGDPIAMAAFLARHPEFRGTGASGISYGPGSGATGGAGGAGGESVPTRVTNDSRDPVPTREVPTPDQAAMDLSAWRGGLATTRKVEEIAKLLYGVTKTDGAGGAALKTIDGGGLRSTAISPTINISLAGAHIGSEAEAKTVATALGREVQNALRMPSMRAI